MRKEIKETLAVDSSKWIKLVEEIEDKQNAEKWKQYLEENNFEVIVPDIILGEILKVLTKKEDTRTWPERKMCLFCFMKSGQKFDFKHIKGQHEEDYYYLKADMLIKKYHINGLLKAKGLYHCLDGVEKYALHKQDLAIFIVLKELKAPYYFVTHDNGIRDALMLAEIREIFIKEGLCFILIHETSNMRNRQVTRIKVIPDY